jgi:hypothetical protein
MGLANHMAHFGAGSCEYQQLSKHTLWTRRLGVDVTLVPWQAMHSEAGR